MFLQQPAQPAQQPGGIIAFLPLLFILGIFYLIVFLPARRRQKKTKEMIDNLKVGDKVDFVVEYKDRSETIVKIEKAK